MKIEKFRPWSFKKRVLVAIVSGLLILIFALLLGSSMYYLGIRNQIFAKQSLKRLLYTQLIEDEELERGVYNNHCTSKLALLLAFFSFVHSFGKNSPKFMSRLLTLVLLCLPTEHTFPKK